MYLHPPCVQNAGCADNKQGRPVYRQGCNSGNSAYLHVLLQLVAPLKVVNISLDWHVVKTEKIVKNNTKVLLQLLFVHPLQDKSHNICIHGSHSFGLPCILLLWGGGVGRGEGDLLKQLGREVQGGVPSQAAERGGGRTYQPAV